MTATYVHHLGNTAAGLRILAREADRLARVGIADYRCRRAVLTTLHSVPISTLARTAVPRTPRDQRLAAAWIWLELTQGTLGLSPHHAGMRRELRSFDQALLGEDRLVLIEYGHQLLRAVADDVARDAQQTATRAWSHADAG